jgi:hypothetical protein
VLVLSVPLMVVMLPVVLPVVAVNMAPLNVPLISTSSITTRSGTIERMILKTAITPLRSASIEVMFVAQAS